MHQHREEFEKLHDRLLKLLEDPEAWNSSGWYWAYEQVAKELAALWGYVK